MGELRLFMSAEAEVEYFTLSGQYLRIGTTSDAGMASALLCRLRLYVLPCEGLATRMTTRNDENSDEETHQRSKVVRIIEEYELTGMEEELVALWTGAEGERHSLRDLAEYVNQELLRTAMENEGMTPLDGEVENTYRLLTDDDTTAGTRIEAESALEREGIDVDKISRDFVSHQAIHTYLTKYRDVEGPNTASDSDKREGTVETITRLQNRLVAVAENSLLSLRKTGRIALGEFSVLVDVRVFCEDCGTQTPITELLENGGCECQ